MGEEKKIPEHIDPRVFKRKGPTSDIINQAKEMRASGSNPFKYVRAAFKSLVDGDYKRAIERLDYAGDFIGVFYDPGSRKDELYREEIITMNITMLFLIEKFEDLKPEE